MSYSDRIRHPDGALNPQDGPNWCLWLIGAGIAVLAALVLIAILRPQWLARIGANLPGVPASLAITRTSTEILLAFTPL